MDVNNILRTFLLIFCLTVSTPLGAFAQGSPDGEGGLGVKLILSAMEQFRANVGSSRVDVSRYRVKVDVDLVKSRQMILNLGASYGISDYTFSGSPVDPWSDPWGEIRSADTGLSLILPGSGRWSYFLASTLDWSWEEGAATADGLVYGIIASAVHAFRMDRRLGFGVGVFEGLEETKIFPYAVVSWKLKEKLTLQNPFRAGPVGPAGLELAWDASDKWQIGSGAAYRSFRFRLDDKGIAPEGVGEMTGIPAWVRASWKMKPGTRLDLYAGAILAGETVIVDSSGRKVDTGHLDPAPMGAVSLKWDL